jgi:hypothetical protein
MAAGGRRVANQYEAARAVSNPELDSESCSPENERITNIMTALLYFGKRKPGSSNPGTFLFVGEETGPGGAIYSMPQEEIPPSLLRFAMRSDDSLTHPWGLTAWRDGHPWCQLPGCGSLLPLLAGESHRRKVCGTSSGVGCSLTRVSISAPRRTSCDKWLGAVTVSGTQARLTLTVYPSRPAHGRKTVRRR